MGLGELKFDFFFSDYDTYSLYILEKEDFKKQTEYLYATPHTKKTIKSHVHSLIDWTNVN